MTDLPPSDPDQASDAREDDASLLRTFLIADVRGSTRYTQMHGDEAAAELAARFAAGTRARVSGFGVR